MDSRNSGSTVGPTLENCITLEWLQVLPTGAGLKNMGNTCYLNTVLQCLTYTPPLANYLLSGEHSRTCFESGFCMICTLEKHMISVLQNPGHINEPVAVVSQLKCIGKQFEYGVQEDAHEFFMCVLEAMHQNYLNECMLTGQTVEGSLVQRIFEGHFRSSIKCATCNTISYSMEPYRDITLSIEGAYTITHALRGYLKCQQLGHQSYKCWNCKTFGNASKKMLIYEVPKALVISLKRFDLSRSKIVRHVRYPELLNMRPFMSQFSGKPEVYRLYGVLVHSGPDCNSGHYYCYIKASDGLWYKISDATVSVSDRRSALSQQAYMLFYMRSPEQSTGESSTKMRPVLDRRLITGGSGDNQSTSLQRKRRLVDEGNDSQELSAKRVMLKRPNRSHVNSNAKQVISRSQAIRKRVHHARCNIREVFLGHKRAQSDLRVSFKKDDFRRRNSGVPAEECSGLSSRRLNVNSRSCDLPVCASLVRERQSHKRRHAADSQQDTCCPKRARTDRPALNFRDYAKRLTSNTIDELCDRFSHLSLV